MLMTPTNTSILHAVGNEWKTRNEIGKELDIPRTTVWDNLRDLFRAGKVGRRIRVTRRRGKRPWEWIAQDQPDGNEGGSSAHTD